SIDKAVEAAREAAGLGIPALATFPNIEMELRDETGSNSLEANNLINMATAAIKKAVPNIGVITDVALDPFTSHGHDDAHPVDARHGRDRVDDARARHDEDRPDQVVDGQP
ncbi:porphobilinogen synthase, partial [Rhizobium ruizarguesonis]